MVPYFRVGRSPKWFTHSGDMLPIMFYRTGGLCLRSDVIDTCLLYTLSTRGLRFLERNFLECDLEFVIPGQIPCLSLLVFYKWCLGP